MSWQGRPYRLPRMTGPSPPPENNPALRAFNVRGACDERPRESRSNL